MTDFFSLLGCAIGAICAMNLADSARNWPTQLAWSIIGLVLFGLAGVAGAR